VEKEGGNEWEPLVDLEEKERTPVEVEDGTSVKEEEDGIKNVFSLYVWWSRNKCMEVQEEFAFK